MNEAPNSTPADAGRGAVVQRPCLPPRPVSRTISGMKTGRGKTVTVATVVLGLVVLVTAFAIKDRAVTEYYLWKLKSGDMVEREASEVAATRFRRTASRAVPGLLGVMAEDFDPSSPRVWCGNCAKVSRWYLASKALEEMGTAALPALCEALQDDNARVREAAAEVLKKIQRE